MLGTLKVIDELFDAVLLLKDKDDCYRFFEDLCTINELKAMSQRLKVAKLLKMKKTYTEIEKETGASTATISRVNRAFLFGSHGYEIVLDDLIDKSEKK